MYGLKRLVSTILLLIHTESLLAVLDPECDFAQQVVLGQEYYIYNPEYPNNRTSQKSCRWVGQSPPGTVIVISCNDVSIPDSRDCQNYKLSFAPNGDPNFLDSADYCGSTTFTSYTEENSVAIGLFPSSGSQGRFLCTLAAMQVSSSCNCGLKRQVGGHETGVNEFPPMAALMDVAKNDSFCGATIISERYALTASHCLLRQTADNLELVVGDHDLSTDQETNFSDRIPIIDFVQHPLYNINTQENDIAVVATSRRILFNSAVGPVCLPFKYNSYNFLWEMVAALGWGFTDFSGNKANTLQEADLYIVSNQDCDNALPENIQTTQICTYADGRDACISDSGGPLLWHDDYSGKLELVGIISFGLACATDKPGVNTRVTAFLPWIVSVTSDNLYCIQ
ncbi:hypothetical protein Zmor_020308 [Zophobas morio]|uniref:Peptidase S1 domain-containing protein n=1 Tax=Zophobas morio TaxID=2755281 RepID=A0AA38I3P2_9CUCU|nr:hypothetical protein Zmor_020308 [Zophobas morio]